MIFWIINDNSSALIFCIRYIYTFFGLIKMSLLWRYRVFRNNLSIILKIKNNTYNLKNIIYLRHAPHPQSLTNPKSPPEGWKASLAAIFLVSNVTQKSEQKISSSEMFRKSATEFYTEFKIKEMASGGKTEWIVISHALSEIPRPKESLLVSL